MRVRNQLRDVWLVGLIALVTLLGACTADDGVSPDSTGNDDAPATTEGSDSTGEDDQDDADAGSGGTLVFGIGADVVHFDPALLPAENFPMIPQLFNTLIRLDENVEPQPELVSDWEFSEDMLTLTLTLRDDVVFHDGTELTAEDIVWNLERYQDEETAANAFVLLQGITSLEAPDATTVVLGFDQPQAAIFDGLDLVYVTKPAEADEIRTTPIGTGPFVLADYVPGDRLLLERNESYWKDGLPRLDQVEMRVLPDNLARAVALENGEIQLMGTPPDDELDRLDGDPNLAVLQSASPSVVSDIMINVTSGPFADARVRQAIHHAIDRERFIDITRAGRSVAWCLPWHDGSIAFTSDARDCPRDLERARELLAEAGYPDGFEATLSSASSEANVTFAQLVASDLEEIGITVTIEQLEGPELRERSVAGDYEFRVHGYGRANRDPSTLLTTTVVFRPEANWSQFASDDYTELVNSLGTTLDPDERRVIAEDLNAFMLEEMFIINVAPSFLSYASIADLEGLELNLDGMPLLEAVSLP